MSDVILFDYWRSLASYRVRIALNSAGVEYQCHSVNLHKQEHKSPEYLGSGPVNFDEMAGEWRNYARKTVQSEVSCLLVPKSGAFRRLRCRKSLKMLAFPAPSLLCLDIGTQQKSPRPFHQN